MTTKIKILDQHCINQIAAGEVVERPLSVVKELIENAIDAGAGKIEILVEGGGDSLIRIKDDGCGISPEDLKLAVLPHATSKISRIDDLNTLSTLGFRGEALPSIAAISKLSIMSRLPKEAVGWEIRIEGGKVVSFTETGCPPGTVVTVEDLFFNTPARKKFLRSANTEFGLISDMVSRLALAKPEISFTLRRPQTLVLNTPGRGKLLDTIASVLGLETARKMIPLEYQEQDLKISGYISSPELVRASRNGVTFIVNGRVIRSQLLNQGLKEGYHTLIPAGTYPIAVLAFTMPPSAYDVNVHPSKLEIKFKEEKTIKTLLSDAIRRTLLTARPIRSITSSSPIVSSSSITSGSLISSNSPISAGKSNSSGVPFSPGKSEPSGSENKFAPGARPGNWQQLKLLYKPLPAERSQNERYPKEPSQIAQYQKEQYQNEPAWAGAAAEEDIRDALGENTAEMKTELPTEIKENAESYGSDSLVFEDLRAIGQVFQTYILCTDNKNLYIMDQHAAHERIRYDELTQQVREQGISSQMLLIPETVELTALEEQILLEHFESLQEIGFIIEHFGDRTYFLRAVPAAANLSQPGKLLTHFIDEILRGSLSPTPEKLLESWLYMMACRTAIKASEKLTLQEMDELIQTLGNRPNPLSCPHGRPTMIAISEKELEERFRRG